MCGICGIYQFNKNLTPKDQALLERMSQTLVHRGPDEHGSYVKGKIGLFHRRLSIIDLTTGKQPLHNEDQTISVIFNGEIYNFRDLEKALVGKGHVFKTKTDTEVIVHQYEEDGSDCVNKFNGMFAYAIWDQNRRRLTLTRDRIGKKPLYYYATDQKLIFASELKAILEDPDVDRELDPEAISDYLSFMCIFSPKTIFKRIKKLPPAHNLICEQGHIRVVPYWDLKWEPCELPESEILEKLNHQVNEAVRSRLIADVPLGAFLSGGVDSSTVVSYMAQNLTTPVKTATIKFQEKEFDESYYAREISRILRTDHYEEVVDHSRLDILDKLIWHLDEPFADASAIPTYYVSKASKNVVTVALSGDGGDEIFGGYRRYLFDAAEICLRQMVPGWIRKGLFKGIASIYPQWDFLPSLLRWKTLLTNLGQDYQKAHYHSVSYLSGENKKPLFNSDMINALGDYHSFSIFEEYYKKAPSTDPLVNLWYVDIKTNLPDRMCAKVDKMSMAASIEIRSPLLDYQLAEFALSIPSNLKLHLKTLEPKYILKKLASKRLPKGLIYRPKMGFDVPLDKWFRKELREKAFDNLFDPNARLSRYFNIPALRKIWDDHQLGLRNNGNALWIFYTFERWLDIFNIR